MFFFSKACKSKEVQKITLFVSVVVSKSLTGKRPTFRQILPTSQATRTVTQYYDSVQIVNLFNEGYLLQIKNIDKV